MPRRATEFIFSIVLVLFACVAAADRVTPIKPIFTEIYLRNAGPHDEKVVGNLVSYDNDSLSIAVGKTQRELKWIDLTPASAFTLRSRLINKNNGGDWLDLARFAWSVGATAQTHTAIENAIALDPTLKAKTDQITLSPSGEAVKTSASIQHEKRELIGTAGGTAPAPTSGPAAPPPRPDDGAPLKPTITFQKSTPEQNDAAVAAAKTMATHVEKKFAVQFTTIETPHFLIFTDWDPREFEFLKTNFEDAYADVSGQFNIPRAENIFIGKLPVLMFTRFSDYAKLTDAIGFLGAPVTRSIRGYYQGNPDGSGRMVMYKPAAEERAEAEKEWAHAVVHEFTHAFVARYHTNASVPRWLNEGVAEVIAAEHFSFPGTYPYARRMAAEHKSAGSLFDDKKMPTGEWYPVMQTMVEYLIARDKSAFLKMFDAIKTGSDGEASLQKFFGLDYDALMSAWRKAMLKSKA